MPSCHAPRRPHLRGALYLLRGGGGGTVQKKTLERLSDEGLSRRPEVRARHVASVLDVLASISCLLVPVSAVLVLVLGVPMPVLVQLLVLVCWCLWCYASGAVLVVPLLLPLLLLLWHTTTTTRFRPPDVLPTSRFSFLFCCFGRC